jgi:putative thiamine transport system ATP-binding protein
VALNLLAVSIRVGGRVLIEPFDLEVVPGAIVTLMGASGSGKSALLSFIGGDLAAPFAGEGRVLLAGRDITCLAPEVRRVGRLFQDDLLFPHLTVGDNLLFGMARGATEARQARMEAALASSGLAGFALRWPHMLSGGQRSRVALMRALLAEPEAMLLDEPFNRLDAALRQQMRDFVFAHLRQRGMPCLMVTHDSADAPPGGRVLRLEDGRVQDA